MALSPTVRLVLATVWMLLALPAVSADAEPTEFTDTSRVVLVEIPVQVTVGGEPVRGLTEDDFEVFDRGKRQELTGFEVIDLEINVPEQPRPSPLDPDVSLAARRHFLLLFDLGFSTGTSMAVAREAVRGWATDALHPWDLVAVAAYRGKAGAELLLNFTTDRDQIDLALASLGSPQVVMGGQDPLGLEIGRRAESFAMEGDTARTGRDVSGNPRGGRGDGDIAEAMALIYDSVYDPLRRHGERHDVFDLTRSMRDLAQMMTDVRGRKYVVYLSEGFDSSLVFASDNLQDIGLLNQASERGEYWRIDGTKRFGSALAQRDLMDMVDHFRRADCVIQAIDISGERDVGANNSLSARGSEGLFFMAHETGGDLMRSFNHLDRDLDALLTKTSVTYLLSFQPGRLKFDDSFHKVKVKLKDAPKGARITHRPGYYAPKPYGEQSPHQRRMSAAEAVLSGTRYEEIEVRALAAPFAGKPSQVPVLLEIDGADLGRSGDRALQLEIYAYALDGEGGIGGFFTNQLGVDLERAGEQLRQNGLKFYGNLELDPGRYSLRVLVRDKLSGARGSDVVAIEVPAVGDGPVVLPPLFPDERGAWLLARSNDAAERPFPFMFNDDPYLPAARPRVASGGESRMFLVAYNLGDGPIDISARIVDGAGRVLDEPSIRLIDRNGPAAAAHAASPYDVLMASLEPGQVRAGSYRLQVTVTDDRTGRSHTNSMRFEVVSASHRRDVPPHRPAKPSR